MARVSHHEARGDAKLAKPGSQLVFVRLAHDRRLVRLVLLLFFLFVLFIGISGRHRVTRDHEGTPVDRPGGKFLGDVLGHGIAPRLWTLGDFTPSVLFPHAGWRRTVGRAPNGRSTLP